MLECVTLDGVLEHEEAFQAIADANGGNRASGLSGYDASVDYVVERMEAAGYNVSLQEFDFFVFEVSAAFGARANRADPDGVRRGHRLRADRSLRAR